MDSVQTPKHPRSAHPDSELVQVALVQRQTPERVVESSAANRLVGSGQQVIKPEVYLEALQLLVQLPTLEQALELLRLPQDLVAVELRLLVKSRPLRVRPTQRLARSRKRTLVPQTPATTKA